jgi:hypothetical protein
MVVVGLSVGWWTTHVSMASRLAESELQLKSAKEYAAEYKLLRRVSVEAGLAPVRQRNGTWTLDRVAAPVPPGSLDAER